MSIEIFSDILIDYYKRPTRIITLPFDSGQDYNLSLIFLATKLSVKCKTSDEGLLNRWLIESDLPSDAAARIIEYINYDIPRSLIDELRYLHMEYVTYRFNTVGGFLLTCLQINKHRNLSLKASFLFKWLWEVDNKVKSGKLGSWLKVMTSSFGGDSCNSCMRITLYGEEYDIPLEGSLDLKMLTSFVEDDGVLFRITTLKHRKKEFVRFRLKDVDEHSIEHIISEENPESVGNYINAIQLLRSLHQSVMCKPVMQFKPMVDMLIRKLLASNDDGLALACYLVFMLEIIPLELTQYSEMSYREFLYSVSKNFGTDSARAHLRRIYEV